MQTNKDTPRDPVLGPFQDMPRAYYRAPKRATEPLYAHLYGMLGDRLSMITHDFDRVASVGERGADAFDIGSIWPSSKPKPQIWQHMDTISPTTSPKQSDSVSAFIGDAAAWPYDRQSLDLILAGPCLHLINDVPGTLSQWHSSLRPDGAVVGLTLGGQSLQELRMAMMVAETELMGGASPRVIPMIEMADASALMQRAGFALPVVDTERLTLTYASLHDLVAELRAVAGTSNVLRHRNARPMSRAFWRRVEDLLPRTEDGRIAITLDLIFFIGWKPVPTQPKPLKPGSAEHRLADALKTTETPLEPVG